MVLTGTAQAGAIRLSRLKLLMSNDVTYRLARIGKMSDFTKFMHTLLIYYIRPYYCYF